MTRAARARCLARARRLRHRPLVARASARLPARRPQDRPAVRRRARRRRSRAGVRRDDRATRGGTRARRRGRGDRDAAPGGDRDVTRLRPRSGLPLRASARRRWASPATSTPSDSLSHARGAHERGVRRGGARSRRGAIGVTGTGREGRPSSASSSGVHRVRVLVGREPCRMRTSVAYASSASRISRERFA